MNVGDPRKAVVLAVIALVVVCAAVYRALPSAPTPVPVIPPASSDASSESEDGANDFAETVSIDPFSHPDLDPAATKPDTDQEPTEPKTEIRKEQVEALKQRPHTQSATDVFGHLPPVDPMNAALKDENAIKFSVEAVVRGDESLALVTIAGHANIAVRVGTVLNGHVKVTAIKQSSVVIEVSGKTLEVTVGDHVTLP